VTDFKINSGDLLPAISGILTRDDGTSVNLTGASVHFVLRAFGDDAPKVNGVATIVGNASLGQVTYFWAAGDTDTPGSYDGAWVVTFPDSTRQTFPTGDYLEVEVALDLTKSGAPLVPVRPTDGIRPMVSEVGALLANRGKDRVGNQFGIQTRPSYAEVRSIINSASAEIDAELDGVAVTPTLASMARWCITLAAAATVELTFFPEQASGGGDTSGIWWARYQSALTRFRELLGKEGGGPPSMFGVRVNSPLLSDVEAIAAMTPLQPWVTPPWAWY
jgi:hypothetical protein